MSHSLSGISGQDEKHLSFKLDSFSTALIPELKRDSAMLVLCQQGGSLHLRLQNTVTLGRIPHCFTDADTKFIA